MSAPTYRIVSSGLRFFAFSLLLTVLAASETRSQIRWTVSERDDRSFIENAGQFDGRNGLSGFDVRYAWDDGRNMVFFHSRGLTYRFDQRDKNKDRKRGDRSKPRVITHTDFVQMTWEGAGSDATITAEGLADDHHTYARVGGDGVRREIEQVKGYRKITYKNLYPNVDLEYEFHPEGGIKYALILHPGADVSQIRMKYDDPMRLSFGSDGHLRISTEAGEIIDHAPLTFYDDNRTEVIASRFELKAGIVTFHLDSYDPARKVVIDPWTVTPPSPNSNRMWNVDVDADGNVYATGGDSPMRLRKYSPDGNLLWTYNTPYDSANYWLGTMATDLEGNCYVTAGSVARISRVNTLGQLQYNVAGGMNDEFWRIAFNADYTQMIVGGTRLTPLNFNNIGHGRVFDVNMATGAINSSVQVSNVSPGFGPIGNPNEVRALSFAPNGNYYHLTLDTIGSFTQQLSLNCATSSEYRFSYKVADYGVDNMGISGIAVSPTFVYTQNGLKLHKRHIVTGEIIAEATIPGGSHATDLGFISPRNSGLAIDDCGNLYVGSGNGVYKFDADLVLLGSTATPAAVYDLKVNRNGEVVASGAGFVMSINMTSCAPLSMELVECLQLGVQSGTLCDMMAVLNFCANNGVVTLTSNYPGGTWSGPGIIDPLNGQFDPSIAGLGVHSIHYIPSVPVPCGSDSVAITVSLCGEPEICADNDGGLVVYNGTAPYAWQTQGTEQDCSACPFGICFPPICNGVEITVWQTASTGSTFTPPGTWPIRVIDAAGNSVVINSMDEVTPCDQACQLEVSVIDLVSACVGEANGSATALATGNIGNVSYSWNTTPQQTTATASSLTAGTYIVSATDAFGCTDADTVVIAQFPAVIAYAGEDTVICLGDTIVLSATGGLSFLWDTGDSTAQISVAPPFTTSYSVIVIGEGNCTDSAAVMVMVDERVCLGLFPNVISPGTEYEGDLSICGMVHQNNVFQLPCLELYPGNRVTIFDRWGRKRHEATNYHLDPWDGNGDTMGVYYWVLELPGTETIHQGFFHIVK